MRDGERYPPIGHYGFLSDCHNWALVSRTGAVDWLCFERQGGHSTFARLLDWDRGGTLQLRPTAEAEVSRRYLDDTNVLRTRFATADGVVTLTDALVLDRREDSPGVSDLHPHGQLVRRVRCERGAVEVRLRLRPRFDYGLTSPHVRLRSPGLATVVGGADALVVHSGIDLEQESWGACRGQARLSAGDERMLSITYRAPHELEAAPIDREELGRRLERTVGVWRGWASRTTYTGAYRDQVVRSALALKGLTDARTGAVTAAATTSLPEDVGGTRNWDYRHTWIRDAAWHLGALFGLGYEAEARGFMSWLSHATAGTADDLQVMYRSTGGRMIPEVELEELEGYRGSSPVRIGNQAAGQFQLDVYGELVSAAWQHHRHGGRLSPEIRHLLRGITDVVERRWQEPDKGIWEVRGAPLQFVSSKLYAWVAVDRTLRLADDGVLAVDRERLRPLRSRIREHIERYGLDPDTGAVLRSFGRPGVDASSLLFVLEGFLDPHDERVDATLEAVRDRLTGRDGDLVHRYAASDGLSGRQGAFWWCSFWVVGVHVARGDVERGRRLFERLLALRSDLGLLSEEIAPDTHELLGNFPQAISHVGLIDAALRLEAAGDGTGPADQPSA